MKEVSKLLEVRESIRVVDATLRDGGLVNDFYFSDEFAKALYLTNIKAGVDYMEMGYRADKEQFDESKFGPWKFSSDEYIRKIVGDNDTDLKIAIMADVGRCNYKEDIHPKAESPVDLIRVATYLHQLPGAVEMIEDADKKGYETTCNIMAISTSSKEDIKAELKDGYLTIKAETNQNNDEKDEDGRYIRKERYTGSCSRSFYVGDAVTQEDIHAAFKDGVLTLNIPKKEAIPQKDETKYIAIEG